MKEDTFVSPLEDYVFKEIFGEKGEVTIFCFFYRELR